MICQKCKEKINAEVQMEYKGKNKYADEADTDTKVYQCPVCKDVELK